MTTMNPFRSFVLPTADDVLKSTAGWARDKKAAEKVTSDGDIRASAVYLEQVILPLVTRRLNDMIKSGKHAVVIDIPHFGRNSIRPPSFEILAAEAKRIQSNRLKKYQKEEEEEEKAQTEHYHRVMGNRGIRRVLYGSSNNSWTYNENGDESNKWCCFVLLRKHLETLGYKLDNVSNPNKGFRIKWRISVLKDSYPRSNNSRNAAVTIATASAAADAKEEEESKEGKNTKPSSSVFPKSLIDKQLKEALLLASLRMNEAIANL